MPGPWEKYQQATPADAPQDGPWAKYGGGQNMPTMTVTAPRETTFDRVNDFGNDLGDAFAHHLGNLPLGAAQLLAHTLVKDRVDTMGSMADAVDPSQRSLSSLITGKQDEQPGLLGSLRSLRQKGIAAVDGAVGKLDQYIANREQKYQQDTPDSVGSYAGAAAGEILPWLTGAGEARAAGIIPKAATKLGKLGLSSAGGAVAASTQPVTSGDFGKEKIIQALSGAASAPVAEGVAAAGSKLGNVISSALRGDKMDPLDKAAASILTREADNPAALSQASPSQIPGVTRTLAEESLDPGVARLERNLRSTNKQFDALDRSNNAARVGALEKIAGSDTDYANAENIRDRVTGQIRDAAFRQGSRYDDALAQQNVMRRAVAHGNQIDSTKGPLEAQIQAIANANQGRPSVLSTMATVSKAVQDAGDSVAGLYNVRKYIGDLLSGKAGGDTAAAQSATRELMGVRDAIDQELTRRAPSFSRYLKAYQDFSQPINRMDVGRDLMAPSSGSAIIDAQTGSQVLTPAQFSKKARDLDAVAARATGFAKAKATDILTPQDIVTIKAIQDDLERQAFRSTAGSGGNSQTFERQAVQDRIARGAGREALRHVPVVGRYAGDFLDMLDKSRNERVKERLAYLVANPSEARRVLAALPPQGQQIVGNALEGIGLPVARIASVDRQVQGDQ